MSILHNAQWEVFAQEVAKGANYSQAARTAGYVSKTAGVYASKLAHTPQIVKRIEELRNSGARLAVAEVALSKEWVLSELMDLEAIAKRKQQVSAATRCVELIGKEMGMFADVIPREIFTAMMAAMGHVVAALVQDPAVLDQIVAGWERIAVAEPRSLKAGILPPPVTKSDD